MKRTFVIYTTWNNTVRLECLVFERVVFVIEWGKFISRWLYNKYVENEIFVLAVWTAQNRFLSSERRTVNPVRVNRANARN